MRVAPANTNTGASTLDLNSYGAKALVDSDLNPITAGMIEGDSIYLLAYNLEADKYQLLGLAKPTVNITDVTHAQLVALVGLANLSVGAKYRITDFQTVHIIPNTVVVNTGIVEPLIVEAISVATISVNAQSTLFPQDELLYQLFDSSTAGGTFGRIYYRKDTLKKNSAYYDWRNVKFRRWVNGVGQMTSITPTAFAFADLYTFNNSASASSCFNNSLGAVAHDNPLGLTNGLNNTILNCESENNFFDFNCINNTIQGGALLGFLPPCYNNNVGANFYGNIFGATLSIPSEAMQRNTIGTYFHDNTSEIFVNNNIGDKFSGNTLTDRFDGNTTKLPVTTITFPASTITNKIFESGNSTFEATKNNLASATIALTGYETICGIINLTHTAGALTITNISGSTGDIPIEFRIASGKVTTFTSASAPTAVATEVVLPTTNFVATGTNKDYLEVVNRSGVLFQTEAINYFV
jgi:hypothetical protein